MDQAEQLRNVIKLHNQNNQNNARVVTITSGKGGVGKSNLCFFHFISISNNICKTDVLCYVIIVPSFYWNAKGTNQGGVLSVEKDKIRIFSTETLQWEEKRRMIKIVF